MMYGKMKIFRCCWIYSRNQRAAFHTFPTFHSILCVDKSHTYSFAAGIKRSQNTLILNTKAEINWNSLLLPFQYFVNNSIFHAKMHSHSRQLYFLVEEHPAVSRLPDEN